MIPSRRSVLLMSWLHAAAVLTATTSGLALHAHAATPPSSSSPENSATTKNLPQSFAMRFRFRYHRTLENGRIRHCAGSNDTKPDINSFVFNAISDHMMKVSGRIGAGQMGGSNPDIPWWQSWIRWRSKNWIESGTFSTPYSSQTELARLTTAADEIPQIIESKLAQEYPDEYFEWIETPYSPPKDMVQLWYTIRMTDAKNDLLPLVQTDFRPRSFQKGRLVMEPYDESSDHWKKEKTTGAAGILLSDAVRKALDCTLGYFNVGSTTQPYPSLPLDAPVKQIHMCLFTRRTRGNRLAKFLAKRAIRKEAGRYDWFSVEFDE